MCNLKTMKRKIIYILLISAITNNLIAQIPPNYISIKLKNLEEYNDINGSFGVINSTENSDSLKISFKNSIDSKYNLENEYFTFEFNTYSSSIFFVNFKNKENSMTLYFSTISNDSGFKYVLDELEFKSGTYYLNLLSSNNGIMNQCINQNDKFTMSKFGLKINSSNFYRFKISDLDISEVGIVKYCLKSDIENGRIIFK